jgi:hypothetical protein
MRAAEGFYTFPDTHSFANLQKIGLINNIDGLYLVNVSWLSINRHCLRDFFTVSFTFSHWLNDLQNVRQL